VLQHVVPRATRRCAVLCCCSGERQQITSTMVDYGIANGDTSMSRTVSLPLAIAVRKIFAGVRPHLRRDRPTGSHLGRDRTRTLIPRSDRVAVGYRV
jgi:hypothetical protein